MQPVDLNQPCTRAAMLARAAVVYPRRTRRGGAWIYSWPAAAKHPNGTATTARA